jgi:hypothetical protein
MQERPWFLFVALALSRRALVFLGCGMVVIGGECVDAFNLQLCPHSV